MTNNGPEISAIIICWDGMQFLPDCLRTLTEDLKSVSSEIVVIDNGSIDDSVSFIKDNYPSVRLIENGENLGFARAVNIGLQNATGDYFYVLNQDLRFRMGTIARLLARLKQDSSIGLIGPRYDYFDGGIQRSTRAFPSYRHVFYRAFLLDRFFPKHREFSSWRMGWFDHLSEMAVDQPMGAVMLIPRWVVDEVGPMDEAFPILFNDVDFCRRIAVAGYKCLYYPEVVVEHYVGASTSRAPVKLHVISHFSLYRYLKKYAKPQEYPLLWLSGLLLLIGLIPVTLRAWIRSRS